MGAPMRWEKVVFALPSSASCAPYRLHREHLTSHRHTLSRAPIPLSIADHRLIEHIRGCYAVSIVSLDQHEKAGANRVNLEVRRTQTSSQSAPLRQNFAHSWRTLQHTFLPLCFEPGGYEACQAPVVNAPLMGLSAVESVQTQDVELYGSMLTRRGSAFNQKDNAFKAC